MTGGLINFLCTVNLSFFDFTCTRSVCGLRSFWQFCSICASTRSPSLSRIDTELGGAACAKISWRSFPSTSTRKVGKDQWLASRLHRKISIISLPGSIKVNLRVLGGSVFCQSYCVAQHYHYAHYVEQCYLCSFAPFSHMIRPRTEMSSMHCDTPPLPGALHLIGLIWTWFFFHKGRLELLSVETGHMTDGLECNLSHAGGRLGRKLSVIWILPVRQMYSRACTACL